MTVTQEPIKRRRVPRRAFHADVGILLNGKYSITKAFQLGEGGMMIAFDRPLKDGQMVLISFKLPGLLLSVVRGVVRYGLSKEADELQRFGIEFLNLDFNYKREIRSYVASKSEAEYKDNEAA